MGLYQGIEPWPWHRCTTIVGALELQQQGQLLPSSCATFRWKHFWRREESNGRTWPQISKQTYQLWNKPPNKHIGPENSCIGILSDRNKQMHFDVDHCVWLEIKKKARALLLQWNRHLAHFGWNKAIKYILLERNKQVLSAELTSHMKPQQSVQFTHFSTALQ